MDQDNQFVALPTTPSSLTPDGYAPKILREEGSYLVLSCLACGQEFRHLRHRVLWGMANNRRIGLTCSKSCARKKWHSVNPNKSYFCNMPPEQRGRSTKPKTLEHRAKLSSVAKAKGHKPKVRLGNGAGMTYAEELISEVLPAGWVWNFPVALGRRQQGFPTNYKLDFAWPHLKIGLEVDGSSHRLVTRQLQDVKKETKLAELGWKVFRISNTQTALLSLTSKLKEHLTTLLGITG